MKKNLLITFSTFLLTLAGCVNNNSNTSGDKNNKYIAASRIYDFQYDVNGYSQDSFTLNEFPDLTFTKNSDKISFSILGREEIGKPKSIYTADINNDGNLELCFCQSRSQGSSSSNTYLVRIYDYHNDKMLFDDNNSKNSFLDLDDDGNLIIEEIEKIGSGFYELEQAGRFLKGSKISFDWYSFDSKLKGMYLELNNRDELGYFAYVDQRTDVILRLFGIGSESVEKSIPIERIDIKKNDDYSCEIKNTSIASQFYISCTFKRTGSLKLEVSIDNLSVSETIRVLSN